MSIGVHVHAEPRRLEATLASLRATCTSSVEVLLLPDGADRETELTLAKVHHLPQHATSTPEGPPACFNRLASATTSDFVILLESGSIVGPGWLDHLLHALTADPQVGLAGPSTNQAWNEQCAFPGAGGGPDEIARTAAIASRRFAGQVRSTAPLHGLADFCFAVRREVIMAVGAADEGYGLGPCWEMEYTARALRAGFRGVWACAAYVWRAPFTARRRREEAARFETSKRRYQQRVCGLRLSGERSGGEYEAHCRGEACEHFAPPQLMQVHQPLPSLSESHITVTPAPAPLVSCIMPTRGRQAFVRQAIQLFKRQDYPNCELIVIAEEAGDVEDRGEDPRIRLIFAPPGESIGQKRNRACAAAHGEIIAQWDDDDWYAPSRLRAQVEPILARSADITGLTARHFLDLATGEFWTCTPQLHRRLFAEDVHGGTLVFKRDVWARGSTYPDSSLAEDAGFLRSALRRGARLRQVPGDEIFVYVRHAENSWRFGCGSYLDPRAWQRIAAPVLPAEDRAFYTGLGACLHPERASNGAPLVSCIMPTHDRRAFVPRAIAYFLRQDYANRELVIVDDGTDPVVDLVPQDARVRYVRLPSRQSLGQKRNICVEHARGDLIMHWDDDDWHARHRISYQVGSLLKQAGQIGGLQKMLFHEPASGRTWLYAYPTTPRPWLIGASLLYTRTLWSQGPFPSVEIGEDARFLFGKPNARIVPLSDYAIYVALIHPGNTSKKNTRAAYWSPWSGHLRTLLGEDASSFIDGGPNVAAVQVPQ